MNDYIYEVLGDGKGIEPTRTESLEEAKGIALEFNTAEVLLYADPDRSVSMARVKDGAWVPQFPSEKKAQDSLQRGNWYFSFGDMMAFGPDEVLEIRDATAIEARRCVDQLIGNRFSFQRSEEEYHKDLADITTIAKSFKRGAFPSEVWRDRPERRCSVDEGHGR